MIGFYIHHKNAFAHSARYMFRQIAKMIGVTMLEVHDFSDVSEHLDALIVYGDSLHSLESKAPTIYIAQADYSQSAALTPQDVRRIEAQQPCLPESIIYFFSRDSRHYATPLYVDEKTKDVKISRDDKNVQCAVDVISTCFYFLSLEHEGRATERDNFDRFQRNFSPLGEDIYETPVVDRYAAMLRRLLQDIVPHLQLESLWPENKNFAVALSHDVDRIPTWTITKARRALRASNSSWKNPARMYRLAQSLLYPENWLGNFNFISRLEQRYGAASTFFFVSQHRHELDPTYKLKSRLIRQGMDIIQSRGCDIGLHGTIPSAATNDFLREEKKHLEFFIDKKVKGARQHYLCFTNDTLEFWQDAGIKYDSTLGFSSHTGYRCGTSFPFHLYAGGKELPILEIPLVLMDTVLFLESKQFLSAAQAWTVIKQHLDETKRNNGLLTINWHNSDLHPYDVYGYSQLYIKILKWTQENNGRLASMNQVYDWWVK